MRRILVVVDMQNDFIDGALGTKEAQAIVPGVVEKIRQYPPDCIFATRDTHQEDYLSTQEGKRLPVVHCVEGSEGWQIRKEVAEAMPDAVVVDKPTFGSGQLVDLICERVLEGGADHRDGDRCAQGQGVEIELVGVCTDICVVSNAILLKVRLPEATVRVDASCCAGVTPESHRAALTTMKMCQVQVDGEA